MLLAGAPLQGAGVKESDDDGNEGKPQADDPIKEKACAREALLEKGLARDQHQKSAQQNQGTQPAPARNRIHWHESRITPATGREQPNPAETEPLPATDLANRGGCITVGAWVVSGKKLQP